MRATTDLEDLGLDEGGHLLVDHALAQLRPGERLTITGRHQALGVHLAAWCREHGHRLAAEAAEADDAPAGQFEVVKGTANEQRWRDARRAGAADGPPDASAARRRCP